jgi:hypothetical protein
MSRIEGHTYSSVQARTRVLLDDDMMREILADVGAMRTALELELWASWILGQTWKQRVRQPLFAEVDWMLTVGTPMVGLIAGIGGARARKALTAISMLERGALGNYAGAIALTLPGARTPAYLADMANARFAAARYAVSDGDGEAVLFDLHRGDRHELTVAVFIDDRLDGAVKWIRLLGPVPAETGGDTMWDTLIPAELPEIAERVRNAIRLADEEPRLKVMPEFADLRAFLLARLIDVCDVRGMSAP